MAIPSPTAGPQAVPLKHAQGALLLLLGASVPGTVAQPPFSMISRRSQVEAFLNSVNFAGASACAWNFSTQIGVSRKFHRLHQLRSCRRPLGRYSCYRIGHSITVGAPRQYCGTTYANADRLVATFNPIAKRGLPWTWGCAAVALGTAPFKAERRSAGQPRSHSAPKFAMPHPARIDMQKGASHTDGIGFGRHISPQTGPSPRVRGWPFVTV